MPDRRPANALIVPACREFTDGHNPSYGHAEGLRLPSLLGVRALRYLAEHPGSSGRAAGRALGIRHDSQTWALLHRFERDGLLTKERNGTASAWTVTEQGHEFLSGLPEGVYV